MSSTSKSKKESIERVIEVCGITEETAKYFLSACDDNVEAAVALFFEQGGTDIIPPTQQMASTNASTSAALFARGGDNTAAAALPDLPILDNGEDDVRAPIAPIREQLIGPQDDNFFGAAQAAQQRMARITQQQRVKVCPLRDFAREGALMEAQLQQEAIAATNPAGETALTTTAEAGNHDIMDPHGPLPSSTYVEANRSRRRIARTTTTTMMNSAHLSQLARGNSRLGDLFRPPTDIAYSGSFQTARARATALQQWLLVNVQSLNFDSQLLNRDVWADKDIRHILRRQFLLWQVDSESPEGLRFVAFYHCGSLPYVCVIDPRTGEEMWHSDTPKQTNLLTDLQKFLKEHKDFSKTLEDDDDAPSTSKRNNNECIVVDEETDVSIVDDAAESPSFEEAMLAIKKRKKLIELSEEEQIALAIRNSMKENGSDNETSNGNQDATNDANENVGNDNNATATNDEANDEHKEFYHMFDRIKKEAAIATVSNINRNGYLNNRSGGGDNFTSKKANKNHKNNKTVTCTRPTSTSTVATTATATSTTNTTTTNTTIITSKNNKPYDNYLGNAKDDLTVLKLRLFNHDGTDQVIELRWPSDTQVKVLRKYVAQEHKHVPLTGYKLICAFPRKTLEPEQDNLTLKEIGLHPSANIHLTLED